MSSHRPEHVNRVIETTFQDLEINQGWTITYSGDEFTLTRPDGTKGGVVSNTMKGSRDQLRGIIRK